MSSQEDYAFFEGRATVAINTQPDSDNKLKIALPKPEFTVKKPISSFF